MNPYGDLFEGCIVRVFVNLYGMLRLRLIIMIEVIDGLEMVRNLGGLCSFERRVWTKGWRQNAKVIACTRQ